jgi:selenide,water dikinase
LRALPAPQHPNLIAGDGLDDAAVYRVREDLAVVATVDVFTPIVDDPRTYGAIAAANSLSDIYAMGAAPRFALAIGAFPRDKLPLETMAEIMLGGAEKAGEAGIPVAGGHTIENPEPVYGLAVIGEAHPGQIVRNSGGRPGDRLILTKPLGTGLICTALRVDEAREEWIEAAVASMLRLNREASEVMLRHSASACTDITGFGLLVHTHELAQASGCAAEIAADSVPLLPGARECLDMGMTAGGLFRNLDHAKAFAEWAPSHDALAKVFADPQTSGGLLIAVPEANAQALLADLAETLPAGSFASIGQLTEGDAGLVRVV